MTASKVAPPTKAKGANEDGAEEAGGVVVSVRGYFGRSWASLRLTEVAFMSLS